MRNTFLCCVSLSWIHVCVIRKNTLLFNNSPKYQKQYIVWGCLTTPAFSHLCAMFSGSFRRQIVHCYCCHHGHLLEETTLNHFITHFYNSTTALFFHLSGLSLHVFTHLCGYVFNVLKFPPPKSQCHILKPQKDVRDEEA